MSTNTPSVAPEFGTAEQIAALDKEFADMMEHLQSAVATRHWTAFREMAEHAGRVAGCLEILDRQHEREKSQEVVTAK